MLYPEKLCITFIIGSFGESLLRKSPLGESLNIRGMTSNISLRKYFTTELNSKNFFGLRIIQDAPRLKGFSLRPSRLEAAGEKRKKMHEIGEAYAKGVTGRMPWRDLLRRSHLPPPVIAECEAQLDGLDPRRPAGAEGQDHPERRTPRVG